MRINEKPSSFKFLSVPKSQCAVCSFLKVFTHLRNPSFLGTVHNDVARGSLAH